jgi:hypothetical protein|mmetsp:Transcript_62822/g.103650  ORF Transcript_62822/g.103650 Transcript_62822/m.103650 type:complete len:113 (-) Transcript_62822:564-902(-)
MLAFQNQKVVVAKVATQARALLATVTAEDTPRVMAEGMVAKARTAKAAEVMGDTETTVDTVVAWDTREWVMVVTSVVLLMMDTADTEAEVVTEADTTAMAEVAGTHRARIVR